MHSLAIPKLLLGGLVITTVQAYSLTLLNQEGAQLQRSSSAEASDEEATSTSISPPTNQLNCTKDPSICKDVCQESSKQLPYSSTFCSTSTGSCVCDCRDSIRHDCTQTPFTPCYQGCVWANPNPDVYLYKGGNCPVQTTEGKGYQCACECTVRDDYEETNDIF